MDVEVGIDKSTEVVQLGILRIPKTTSNGLFSSLQDYSSHLKDALSQIHPNVIIAGTNYWRTAYILAKHFDIPLILWVNAAAFGLHKLPVYIKYGKNFKKSLMLLLGFGYNYLLSCFSNYLITRDLLSISTLRKMGMRNIEIVWPTYARFTEKDAYAKFLGGEKASQGIAHLTLPYVLSVITLQKGSHAYYIEAKAIDFLINIATKMPEVNFLVIGTSPEDIKALYGYKYPKNLLPLGKVYDDREMAKLYRNAFCVVAPIYIPGFTNRILEAYFYSKPLVSTPLVDKSFKGLKDNVNIMFSKNPTEAVERITKVLVDEQFRMKLEENARRYYLEYFSPEMHARKLEQIIRRVRE